MTSRQRRMASKRRRHQRGFVRFDPAIEQIEMSVPWWRRIFSR